MIVRHWRGWTTPANADACTAHYRDEVLPHLSAIEGFHGSHLLRMVNAAPGFQDEPAVSNGCSDLILDLFGQEIGQHARSAVGLAELPWNIPGEIEAEVAIRP